jgi:VanZ family protein
MSTHHHVTTLHIVASLWIPVVAYMGMLYWFSSWTDVPDAPAGLSDKHIHFALYAGLAAVSGRALARGQWRQLTLVSALGATAIASAYGVFDEFHQTWVPGRMFEIADMIVDTLGALAASAALWAWSIIRGRYPTGAPYVL